MCNLFGNDCRASDSAKCVKLGLGQPYNVFSLLALIKQQQRRIGSNETLNGRICAGLLLRRKETPDLSFPDNLMGKVNASSANVPITTFYDYSVTGHHGYDIPDALYVIPRECNFDLHLFGRTPVSVDGFCSAGHRCSM